MRRSAYPQLQALCLLIAVLFFSSSAFSHTASSSNGNSPERSIYIESQTAVLEGLTRVVDDGVSITDVTYAHLNHLGSPIAFTDDSGNVVWPGQSGGTPYEIHSYEPFGADFADLGSPLLVEQDVRYTGKLFDASTGKHYFNARYYNGITTDSSYEMPPRFLSPDNVKGNSEEPQSWNVYAYCLDNPLRYIDPDGNNEVPVAWHPWDKISDQPYDIFGVRSMIDISTSINGASAKSMQVSVKGSPVVTTSRAQIGATAAAAKNEMTMVTSWADKGIIPDLNPGRWVMKGEATKWNFWKSGLPGPKVVRTGKFPYFRIQKSQADFLNSITDEVPTSSLKLPPGPEVIKAPLGQRVLGGGE